MTKNAVKLVKCRIGDYIKDIASGPFGSNLKVECFKPTGFPIIDGANLTGLKVSDNVTKFVTEEKARSLPRSIAKRGDVVVTISGTLGQIAYVPYNSKYEEYLCSQRQFRATFDETKVCVEYLVSLFHTPYGQRKILAFANYVGVPALAQPIPNFRNIEMHLPDLPTQLRIAGVLGSLDEKIELNRKKIAELEALAKTIYDYWFVQFDFPDKNGKPYRSSGGKMVWNEQLKREIPTGWRNGKLSDIAYYASDKIQSNAIPLENYVTTDSMLQKKQGRDIATSLPPHGTSIVCFRESDTLVANIRPYLQKIWFSNVQGGCSQDVLVFRAKKSCVPTFLYSTLWQDNFFDYVMTGAKGSKMPRGDKEHIMSYPLAIPVESLLSQYNQIVSDFWSCRNFAFQQITELTALRNLLIPLLMNGQVVVK